VKVCAANQPAAATPILPLGMTDIQGGALDPTANTILTGAPIPAGANPKLDSNQKRRERPPNYPSNERIQIIAVFRKINAGFNVSILRVHIVPKSLYAMGLTMNESNVMVTP
jgi:hypothetical protein